MRKVLTQHNPSIRRLVCDSGKRVNYVTNFQIHRQIWDLNMYDDDNWPSVPHGHSLDGKYKLNVWTGEIFEITTKKRVGHARKKELNVLYSNNEFIKFARSAIQYHKEHFPYHSFDIPDWFNAKTRKRQAYAAFNEDTHFRLSIIVIYD
ncbi:MAG: hypothetical protein IJM20_01840 [Clostridia bacterium]|nr:hypothetical protein [Clostridia bacterium]